MTVDLWASNCARLVLFEGSTVHADVIVPAPATVVVGGRWLTLQGGETRFVLSPHGEWRHATEADVLGLDPIG